MRFATVLTGLAVCVAGVTAQSSSDNTKTDTRFLGVIPGLSTGNTQTDSFVNGGILGAGLLGGAGLLTGAINPGILTGGLGGSNNCGRRKRRQSSTNTKFFLPNNNCNNPCGRRKRQASGDRAGGDKTNTRFFLGGNNNQCGSGGYSNGGFSNGGYSNGGYSNGGSSYNNGGYSNGGSSYNNGGYSNNNGGYSSGGQGCKCTQLTINNGREGNCRSSDKTTGRTWCYTTGWGGSCGDYHSSQQYPNNPWSYNACSNQWGK